jgi:hypothetical protein
VSAELESPVPFDSPAFSAFLPWNLPLAACCPWPALAWSDLPGASGADTSADAVACEEAASVDPSEARACCDRNISKKKDATANSVKRTARRHACNNRGSSGKWYVLNPPLSSPKDPINR